MRNGEKKITPNTIKKNWEMGEIDTETVFALGVTDSVALVVLLEGSDAGAD